MNKAQIGIVGLAVMGQNLVLNLADRGFRVVVFNRTCEKMHRFLAERGSGKEIIGVETLEKLCQLLSSPRKVFLMVPAGQAVDQMIENCLPYLERGDLIIDGGNSFFRDSQRRLNQLQERGIGFLGVGISGGEKGARNGPSIMPGGNEKAWNDCSFLLRQIAAQIPSGEGTCCDWMGPGGSGHYVKMVHNGIEYGEMQLLCEAYDLLKRGYLLSDGQIADLFDSWNRGVAENYLLRITAHILHYSDRRERGLLDVILDVAGQKGTGKWMVEESVQLGVPATILQEAIAARFLSGYRGEREQAWQQYSEAGKGMEEKAEEVSWVREALGASRIVNYAQGFTLLQRASAAYDWKLSLSRIASVWRGGCILQGAILEKIMHAFDRNEKLPSLLSDPFFVREILQGEESWRRALMKAVACGIPTPCLSSALSFFDGYRSRRLPANLLQAQRDCFGAHTYERIDRPGSFHTEWNLPD